MNFDKDKFTLFFRYLWLIIFSGLILFVASQSVFTKRSLVYYLDFHKSSDKDIVGWYPESRVLVESSRGDDFVGLMAEPVYLKVYSPVDFKRMSISGYLEKGEISANLGLRQKDGSWEFKSIDSDNFSVDFDLSDAQIKRNQLEIILSLPDMSGSVLKLSNDWKITLQR